ncbi:MAG: hypothetical protein Q6366_011385 [Candidatus Freyarchaeota archaeon]
MTKPFVKDAVGHFRNLLIHSAREYEPSPEHVLKRLLRPLCQDLNYIIEKGTTRDAKETLTLFQKECKKIE